MNLSPVVSRVMAGAMSAMSSRALRLLALGTVVATGLNLTGCSSATRLVANPNQSSTLKAKNYANYKELYLLPPDTDPRNVMPRLATAFEQMGYKVTVYPPGKSIEGAQGTGFLIGDDGFILTCAHVLGEEKTATVTLNGNRYFADVVKADKDADLALLKTRDKPNPAVTSLSFRSVNKDYHMGEDVFTIGYPLSSLLGNSARMTKGLLSAATGLRDDPKQVQVSAEIQPGNSGGPLLDKDGQIIGVIQQTINPFAVAQATGGALPQNINFSIKHSHVLDFVKGASEPAYKAVRFDKAGGLEKAGPAVAKIIAGISTVEGDRANKIVVRLNYISKWDMWYRFSLFALTVYDFETRERLFTTGQGYDNMVSNEDVVINDTLAQFKRGMGLH
ncbi:MAG: trypsin-like peptidase domain-containing protein [Aquabacterium sp.]|uniref:S1C family serine protease n=1 Tax=Aquabacterium sp. TaxID=1872578 RepID=UPI0025B8970D|nr:serine protease [Aquabacterium sp.]MBI3381090.1 trypsin-like peptidase domain-containing protein [Aquabacterium sp.]